jgi:UDP-N-acetylglucosamine:LPS N-acetylglucosamine transferase
VTRLAREPEKLIAMGEAARRLAKPGAARRAAEVLEEKSR